MRCDGDAAGGAAQILDALAETVRLSLWRVADRELDAHLRSKVAPSDVVQETMLRAQRGIHALRLESEAELMAWLRCILRNYLVDLRRAFSADKRAADREQRPGVDSRSWRRLAGVKVDRTTPSRVAIALEEAALVERAMANLSDEHQMALRLRSWEQLPLAEAARRMNRSPEAVRKLWGRALEQLQSELAKLGYRAGHAG